MILIAGLVLSKCYEAITEIGNQKSRILGPVKFKVGIVILAYCKTRLDAVLQISWDILDVFMKHML